MEVGDMTSEWVHFGDQKAKRMRGRVTYIHPKRRFYTVEFQLAGGRFSESYLFPGHGRIEADNRDQ